MAARSAGKPVVAWFDNDQLNTAEYRRRLLLMWRGRAGQNKARYTALGGAMAGHDDGYHPSLLGRPRQAHRDTTRRDTTRRDTTRHDSYVKVIQDACRRARYR